MQHYFQPMRSVLLTCLGILLLVLSSPAPAQEVLNLPQWRYTTDQPASGWETSGYQDEAWKFGIGGFGSVGDKTAPGSVVNMEWNTSAIWLRRTFELNKKFANPMLLIHHDDDAEVFLNGRLIGKFAGYTVNYTLVPLDDAGIKALKVGLNLLAVHCHQGAGGQYIDAHIVDGDALPDIRRLVGRDGAVRSSLITAWGEKVTAQNAWREYPRPQLEREQWTNLNGKWDYAVTALTSSGPSTWAGQILVPFPMESKLSGVRRMLQPYEALWYRRTFEAAPKKEKRTILNFEAVDYQCQVWVNDQKIGSHIGGNLPFSFDITDALKKGGNTLVVRVEDATGGTQLAGKQRLNPGGIFYTRNSGIWQTVWLEEVPERRIADISISSDIKTGEIFIKSTLQGKSIQGESVQAEVLDGGKIVAKAAGGSDSLAIKIPQPKLWSPGNPHLYDITISLRDAAGRNIDQVKSYTGLRKVGSARDSEGNRRFTLNDKPIFHWGPLDQGWWPDGLLTPPSDDAMIFEIKWLKAAGFNLIRKHIKVEPRRYYRHCDEIGMLVWQDQVSGGPSPDWTRMDLHPHDAQWSDEDHQQWLAEFDQMISVLDHFPCIVVWDPFNEAWGQHRTMEVGKWAMERDPSRLINIASGGNFWPIGHIADQHAYPDPDFPVNDPRYHDFIKVVGEFGGHGWPVRGRLWVESRENWGYGGLPASLDEYRQRYEQSIRVLTGLKAKGIAAGVYTQTTDVEGELNGLMSYDRKVIKIPAAELRKINAPLTAD